MARAPMGPGEWPSWLNLFVATLSGVIIGVGVCVKWMWSISDRVLHLETKVGLTTVAESLRLDRHDHVYPMLQERIILPLDMLEAKVNVHDSSLAILLDRSQLADKMENLIRRLDRERKT